MASFDSALSLFSRRGIVSTIDIQDISLAVPHLLVTYRPISFSGRPHPTPKGALSPQKTTMCGIKFEIRPVRNEVGGGGGGRVYLPHPPRLLRAWGLYPPPPPQPPWGFMPPMELLLLLFEVMTAFGSSRYLHPGPSSSSFLRIASSSSSMARCLRYKV